MEIKEKAHELIHLDEARALVDAIYAVEVSSMVDDDLQVLESLIDKMIQALSALPTAAIATLIDRLRIAREGVEQGVSPDPSRRPSVEEMRQFVAAHLN
jgi:hypothetical protein